MCLFMLLKKMGASFKVSIYFFAAAMLTPVLFFHQAELISETLLVPLTAAALWSLFLGREKLLCILCAGAALGGMILTHGIMLGFSVAEVVFFFWRKEYRKARDCHRRTI